MSRRIDRRLYMGGSGSAVDFAPGHSRFDGDVLEYIRACVGRMRLNLGEFEKFDGNRSRNGVSHDGADLLMGIAEWDALRDKVICQIGGV